MIESTPFFVSEIKFDSKTFTCTGFPILNTGGKGIGVVLVLSDISHFTFVVDKNKNIFLIGSLIFFIITFLIFNFIIFKIFLNNFSYLILKFSIVSIRFKKQKNLYYY